MRPGDLRRFAPLYRSARYYGADVILRRHLGVGPDFLLPLGLAHGADFGPSGKPMEIEAIEPVHWSTNASLHGDAIRTKPSARIPHPLLLSLERIPPAVRHELLVIGPPPGVENDRRLLRGLRAMGIDAGTILVKRRRGWEGSCAFWQSNGFETTTLAPHDRATYDDMLDVLGSYRHVVGCTISSAVIFAAAAGARISFVRGYSYVGYEILDASTIMLEATEEAVEFVRVLAGDDHPRKIAASRAVLGGDLDAMPSALRDEIARAIDRVVAPVHYPRAYPRLLRTALREVALRTGRPGVVTVPLVERLKSRVKPTIAIREIDEVAFWLEGRRAESCVVRATPFVPGVTIPGEAVDPYPSS